MTEGKFFFFFATTITNDADSYGRKNKYELKCCYMVISCCTSTYTLCLKNNDGDGRYDDDEEQNVREMGKNEQNV